MLPHDTEERAKYLLGSDAAPTGKLRIMCADRGPDRLQQLWRGMMGVDWLDVPVETGEAKPRIDEAEIDRLVAEWRATNGAGNVAFAPAPRFKIGDRVRIKQEAVEVGKRYHFPRGPLVVDRVSGDAMPYRYQVKRDPSEIEFWLAVEGLLETAERSE